MITGLFLDFYQEFINYKKQLLGIEITKKIVNKHQRIYQKFNNYLGKKKSETLDFSDLDNELGKNFFTYLKTKCNLSHNTAVKQMQLFKSVIKDGTCMPPFNPLINHLKKQVLTVTFV